MNNNDHFNNKGHFIYQFFVAGIEYLRKNSFKRERFIKSHGFREFSPWSAGQLSEVFDRVESHILEHKIDIQGLPAHGSQEEKGK